MSDDPKNQAPAARKNGPSGRRAKKKGGHAAGREQDQAASKSARSGSDPQPSSAAKEPVKNVLEFSQPSTSPPKPSGFKPDPEKARKLRQAKQGAEAAPDPDTGFPPQPRAGSKRAAKQRPDQGRKTAGQAKGAAAARPGRSEPGKATGAVLQGGKARAHPLFRKRNRSLTLAFVATVAVAVVWWTGAFEERFDLARQDDPTTETATSELESSQAETAAASEAAELLTSLGLLKTGAEESSEQDLEAAIRMYQEMAGLTVDGQVSSELLEDLRAVAEFTERQE